jgi:hypothetical protein
MKTIFPTVGIYFDAAVRLEWFKGPVSSAGGSVAAGRVSHAGQIESEDPDEKAYPSSPGWGLVIRLTSPG